MKHFDDCVRRHTVCSLGLFLVLALGLPAPAAAQIPSGLIPSQTPARPDPNPPSALPEVEAPDSPRASLRAFAELTTKQGDYAGAARYLSLQASEQARGPELARQLRAVLERHLDIDVDVISPNSEGDARDGLPRDVDRLGDIPDVRGGRDPVFVVRTTDARGPFWAFSAKTVSRIPEWYEALPDRWVRDWMPQRWQRRGQAGFLLWQWIGLPILVLVALVIGRALGRIAQWLLARTVSRTAADWDDTLLTETAGVLTLVGALVAAAALLPWLALLPEAAGRVRSWWLGLAAATALWALWRAVDVWATHLTSRPWAVHNPSARSLISIVRNIGKAMVAFGGLLAILGAFGYPVASVLAGLGIGGIALAFGAQKTVENLFGSIALAADQPFHVGDFVRVEDITGNVEHIGVRSTQIRTPDRTLVTMPNGRLSELRIEDFSKRDRMRFFTTLKLVHGTSEAQLKRILQDIERLLRVDLEVWPDEVQVNLVALSPSSLDIDIICWFRTVAAPEFLARRQAALIGIVGIVREAGTSFAVPMQVIQVTRDEGTLRSAPDGT